MAIQYVREKKKQRYLTIIFSAVILITFIVLWQGFLKKKPQVSLLSSFTWREIKINFDTLESPELINLRQFETIPSIFSEADNVPLNPTLSWESVPGAEIYVWEVLGAESGETKETSVAIVNKLKPSTVYIWRVKACKEDMSECSGWSGDCQKGYESRCWRFATLTKPSLSLVSPSSEADNVPLNPTLSWESVPGAKIYVWEVLGAESGETKETSVAIVNKLKPSTVYIWRVKACKEDMSECSGWSERTFSTAKSFASPGLISPPASEIFIGRENPFSPF